MNIYYRKVVTWCAYPFHDCIDETYVEYSKGKGRKFVPFLKSETALSMDERKKLVAETLNQPIKNITLIKH